MFSWQIQAPAKLPHSTWKRKKSAARPSWSAPATSWPLIRLLARSGGKVPCLSTALTKSAPAAPDKRTPFDQIRSRLDQLGKPRFRISCREADWLGENDRAHLAAISQDGRVKTLRLEPLNDSDVETILGDRFDEGKVREFLAQAEAHSVTSLLYNPQTLGLLADVFELDGHWPETRLELFERACRLMVRESNKEHRLGETRRSADEFLRWAGRLCAVALISGRAGLSLNDMEDSQRHVPLGLFDEEGQSGASAALASRLFRAHEEGIFVPVHRHIAEFLAARSLATLIEEGLPLARVLALLSGGDGMVVTELRGLSAWLAALSVGSRGRLIEQDPYGVALYGDISQFSRLEKQRLLSAVSRETSRLNGPMWGTAEIFKSLAIPEMASTFLAYFSEPSSAREHQLFLVFLLDILLAGGPVPGLSEALFQLVRDETRLPAVRQRAAQVLVEAHSDEPDIQDRLRALLDDVADGRVPDEDNELLGTLLGGLFPQTVATQRDMGIPPCRFLTGTTWGPFSCSGQRLSWTGPARRRISWPLFSMAFLKVSTNSGVCSPGNMYRVFQAASW